MDALAVEQAKARLKKAGSALNELEAAENYETAETAWTDFLLAASTVYSKLEQGSKSNRKSSGWFGRKKKERRDDPLLRYLHHARNSDEHGIERVVARGGNATGFGNKPLKFNHREAVTIHRLDDNRQPIPESATKGYLYGPSIQLVRVHDTRFNDHCDPPLQHLSREIDVDDNYPLGIGRIALRYLEAIVSEAEGLASASKAIAK